MNTLEYLFNDSGVLEREPALTPDVVRGMEWVISRMAAVMRYRAARKYCFGRVLDVACGGGYGSYVISMNPDVDCVVGADRSDDSVRAAGESFGCERVRFTRVDFSDGLSEIDFAPDVVVSLETIEHLDDPCGFIESIKATGAKRLVLSYPNYKSTHFNPHHKHDIQYEDVRVWVGREPIVKLNLLDEVDFLVFDLE